MSSLIVAGAGIAIVLAVVSFVITFRVVRTNRERQAERIQALQALASAPPRRESHSAEPLRVGGRAFAGTLNLTGPLTIRVAAKAGDTLLAFTGAMGGGRPSRLGVLPIIIDAIQAGYRIEPGWHDVGWMFADGTASLAGALADGLDVRVGHIVRAVQDDGAGVAVGDHRPV